MKRSKHQVMCSKLAESVDYFIELGRRGGVITPHSMVFMHGLVLVQAVFARIYGKWPESVSKKVPQ